MAQLSFFHLELRGIYAHLIVFRVFWGEKKMSVSKQGKLKARQRQKKAQNTQNLVEFIMDADTIALK